jgi:hypothetical protein
MGYVRKPRPVIRIYRDDEPSVWRWLGPLLAASVVLLGVSGYWLVSSLTGGDSGLSVAEARELRQTIDDLKTQNQSLREQLARAVRSSEIDSKAGEELMATLAQREKELLDLREELDFYKRMVSSEKKGGVSSISIRSFSMMPADKEGAYHYKLVVARVDGKGKPVKGRVQLRLQGREKGESRTLEWQDISSGGDLPRFKFQFFQTLEGELEIPAGFEPEHILVKVMPDGKKQQSVQQSFSWNSVNEGKKSVAGKEKGKKVDED